jgi:quaternary ammonium compound-resistance protein SugE
MTLTTAWILLVLAGLLEIAWATGLKLSDGFTKLKPSVITIALMLASFALLARTFRIIPMGTAYAVWTGIGAFGTGVIGIVRYGEPAHPVRLLCLGAIIAGTVGLKLLSK